MILGESEDWGLGSLRKDYYFERGSEEGKRIPHLRSFSYGRLHHSEEHVA
jgi:hypothetical protein